MDFGIVVPLDRTLKYDELEFAINNAEADVVICSSKYASDVQKIRRKKGSTIKLVINMDAEKSNKKEEAFKELIEKGNHLIEKNKLDYVNISIDPKATSILIYTSATTGTAKLVALNQEAICANVGGIAATIPIDRTDVMLSFLPLNHVFECTVGFLYPIYRGALITYADGIKYLAENIKEYKVTMMISVPLLFEGIQKAILREIKKRGKERIFKIGLRLSRMLMKVGIDKRKEIFSDIHKQLRRKC